MPNVDVELVVDSKSKLGEGPIWDDREKGLWWINILDQELYWFDPQKNDNRTFALGQMIGTVVPRESGGLILALENGVATFDPTSETISFVVDPEAHISGNRFNDGKCDPDGRFWAGTMSKEEEPNCGTLYCVHPDGRCEPKLRDLTVSNGIVWTADRSTMYFIDSPTRRVDAFDFSEDGTIGNRRTAIEIPEGLGFPDGMSIDSDDNLWVGMWSGWCVAKFDPRNGQLLEKLQMPVANVTACAFGGDDLHDLYITTARVGIDDDALKKQPSAGGLFRVHVDVAGTKAFAYRG